MRVLRRSNRVAVPLLIGAALLAAACGSSGKSSSASNTTVAATGGSTGSGPAASGTPVTVFFNGWNPTDPSIGASQGALAAEKSINAAGGINGHPVKLVTCNVAPASDSAGQVAQVSQTCTQHAISNTSVVASLGLSCGGPSPDQSFAMLQAAGLACVGEGPDSPTNFTSKIDFPVEVGFPVVIGQAVVAVENLGSKKPGVAVVDSPATSALVPLINSVLKGLGSPPVKSVPVPATATDLTPEAAALSGTDSVTAILTTSQSIPLVRTLRGLGNEVVVSLPGNGYGINTLSSSFPSFNGVALAALFDRQSQGYSMYENDMKAIGKYNTAYDNDYSAIDWLSLEAFAGVARALPAGGVTRAGILNAFNQETNLNTFGMTPTINYTNIAPALGGLITRAANPTVVGYKWNPSSKTISPVGGNKFVNVFGQ